MLIAFSICSINKVYSQKQRALPPNLENYDDSRYHFGFTLSANFMGFRLNTADGYTEHIYNSASVDSVFNFGNGTEMKINNIQTVHNPGFSVGIVGNFRLGKYFDLRIVPGLTLAFRQVVFDFDEKKRNSTEFTHFEPLDVHINNMQLESVFIDLPVMIKYKGQRIYNMRPYILGGVEYKFDLLAVKALQNRNVRKDDFVPLKPHDLYATIGTGLDFYMFWFKLGIELRMSYGLFDIVNREMKDTFCTRSIETLRSKQFNITFTFE
ncbi:PorT family protein [Bacteroidales bacterium OttesenSCG-928-K22]|nr:PorT family protein [Bacteroidales bacterium OttesenSCG-928-K22]